MNKRKNKAISASLMAVMTATSVAGVAHSVNETQVASAAVNQDVHAVHAKVEHITYSLKKNYLGLKNLGQWQAYIKEARKLNEKLPNGSSKEKFAGRIDRAEALVNAAARVNQVEKSMAVNANIMKNVPQWEEYIELAKKDLAKVDLGVFKNRYNELLERTAERFKGIEKVKTSYKESYNKVEDLIKEAEKLEKTDKDKAIEKYKEAKKEAEKLQSHSSKEDILKNIDKVITENSGSSQKPEEKPEDKPSTGGGRGSSSSSIIRNPNVKVNIPDAKLKKVINHAISPDRKEDAQVTKSEIESIKKLRSDDVLAFLPKDKWSSEAPDRGIRSLEGLEHAVNLEEVDLSENGIKDLTPLKDLKKLTYLELDRNMLGDLTPLKDIVTLEHLNIYNNEDIVDTTPLKGLINLKWIDLHYCNRGKETVKVAPLGNLVNLEYLNFESNFISDISFLQNLTKLKNVGFGANNITDLTKVPQDLLRDACVEEKSFLSPDDPEYRYVGMYGQRLKDPVNIKLSGEKSTYTIPNPVKGLDMILKHFGVEQPGLELSSGEIGGVELSYNKGKEEIEVTIDPNVIDLKENSAPSIHLDYANYMLVINLNITKDAVVDKDKTVEQSDAEKAGINIPDSK